MSLLSCLEGVLETIVEGSFRRFFGAPLQPVELARALARAMLAERVVAAASVDVPNCYSAYLNPVEFDRLAPLRATIERETAEYLEREASRHNLRPIGPIRVTLEADPGVPRSTVRAEARFDEGVAAADTILGRTRRFEPLLTPLRSGVRPLIVVDEDGGTLRVDGDRLTIGRSPDNDLVIPDIRVSRHHAVIVSTSEGWTVRDLHSTNGTFVDGEPVTEARIAARVTLSLGGHQLTLFPDRARAE